ncbi:MAG: ferredoxin-thioredoxin reductase catalytic domain-containing protein [Planctomycetota bacterium]
MGQDEGNSGEMDALRKALLDKIAGGAYAFSADEGRVSVVLRGLLKRKEKRGEYYCPCRVLSGDPEEDRKIICPCAYMADDIRRAGICQCGLFVRR